MRPIALLFLCCMCLAPAWAQPDPKKPLFDKSQLGPTSVTKHTVTIAGVPITYTATAGYLTMTNESGEEKAYIFYIAYTRDGLKDQASRPLTFAFNGGPGAASVWLHLGMLGPQRVIVSDVGVTTPPPYRLTENQESWLDLTDLVFIDPVSTGYSRAISDEVASKEYYGYTPDIRSFGEFIRQYISINGRWASPKFLIGESYGTARACGLSNYLASAYGMYLNGVVLVSSITNFQTAYFNEGNDLPYIMFLPSYAASAYYHKRLAPDILRRPLSEFLDDVENFAFNEYSIALMKGDVISEDDRRKAIGKLSMYTGLSATYIERSNLRLWIQGFRKELLRADYEVVGRFDSRVKLIDLDANNHISDIDPSYTAAQGAFSGCINDYIPNVLKYKCNLNYEILTNKVKPWSYNEGQNRYLNAAEDLRKAMLQNPHMKVWIANGYFDLATPYFATEYTVNHMGLDRRQRTNVTLTYYEAGHMIYLHPESRVKMKEDARTFFTNATANVTAAAAPSGK